MFDGGPSQGALTYWLLKTAAAGTEGLTFRTVYDQVTARIHDQFPAQTPMLFGNPDRALLGDAVVGATAAVPVTGVSGQTLTLGAGETALVQLGAEYTVYPASAKSPPDPADRVAVVRVTAVKPTTATATVTQTFLPRGAQPGDRAVPVGAPLRLVRKIGVVRRTEHRPRPATRSARSRRPSPVRRGSSWPLRPAVRPTSS